MERRPVRFRPTERSLGLRRSPCFGGRRVARVVTQPTASTTSRASAYFYEPVAWAKATGITMGVSPTRFGPADNVDRAQIATFLFRYHHNVAAASGSRVRGPE